MYELDIPADADPARVYGTIEWERVKLSSIPIPVRKAVADNFEVITPAEAKRRFMEVYKRQHPAPKPVVLSVPRPSKGARAKPALVEAIALAPPSPASIDLPQIEAEPAKSEPAKSEPAIDHARDWLMLSITPKIISVIRDTSAYYGVSVMDVLSHRRTADVMRPRQIAMYLAKTLTLRSLPEIGRRFGGRDHTTVLHAVRKIEALIEAGDAGVIADVAAIKVRIGGAP